MITSSLYSFDPSLVVIAKIFHKKTLNLLVVTPHTFLNLYLFFFAKLHG